MLRFSVLFFWLLLWSFAFGNAAALARSQSDTDNFAEQANEFDYDVALRLSQSAIGIQLTEQSFVNSSGAQVRLSDFHGKPLVLSLVYTSCYQICPMTTRHLSKVVEKAREALGRDSFSVAVVGFDTRFDTSDAMGFFAEKQDISDKGWNLLSIDQAGIERLAKDVGFVFYPSSNGFDHLIQATVIDADGKVYRQVYGQVFETPLLVDPLIDLVLDRPQPAESLLSDLTKKVKLFCTTYDPVRDGYYFDYSLFLGMLIGAIIIAYTVFVMIRETRAR